MPFSSLVRRTVVLADHSRDGVEQVGIAQEAPVPVEERGIDQRGRQAGVEDPAQEHVDLGSRPEALVAQREGLAKERDAFPWSRRASEVVQVVEVGHAGGERHADRGDGRSESLAAYHLVERGSSGGRAPHAADELAVTRGQLAATDSGLTVVEPARARAAEQRNRQPATVAVGRAVEVVRASPAQRRPGSHGTVAADSHRLLEDPLLDPGAVHLGRDVPPVGAGPPPTPLRLPASGAGDASRVDPGRPHQVEWAFAARGPVLVVHAPTVRPTGDQSPCLAPRAVDDADRTSAVDDSGVQLLRRRNHPLMRRRDDFGGGLPMVRSGCTPGRARGRAARGTARRR